MTSARDKKKPVIINAPKITDVKLIGSKVVGGKRAELRYQRYMRKFTESLKANKRRLGVFGAITAVFAGSLYRYQNHENEFVRMALAGSLASVIWDVGFHFADTVNARLKVHSKYKNTYALLHIIAKEEGIYGITKGISAWYYSSIVWGALYFGLYK